MERVTARIRPENAASLRAFAAAGFEPIGEENDLVVSVVVVGRGARDA